MKYMVRILALLSLVLMLVGCSAGGAQTHSTTPPAVTLTPTHPSIPSGTVLYQADWSHGLAAFGNPPGWKVVNGMLQSDLSDSNKLTLPYISTDPNYALEVHFQIVSVPVNGGYFVVNADQKKGKDGYNAGILSLLGPAAHNQFANPQVQVYIIPSDDMGSRMVTSDYEPGSSQHTYRIEVQDSNVTFKINDVRKSSAYSTVTNVLSNGPFEVASSGAVVDVSSISIMAL